MGISLNWLLFQWKNSDKTLHSRLDLGMTLWLSIWDRLRKKKSRNTKSLHHFTLSILWVTKTEFLLKIAINHIAVTKPQRTTTTITTTITSFQTIGIQLLYFRVKRILRQYNRQDAGPITPNRAHGNRRDRYTLRGIINSFQKLNSQY